MGIRAANKELEEIEDMMRQLEWMEGGDGSNGLGTLLDDFVVTATMVSVPLPPSFPNYFYTKSGGDCFAVC